MKSNEIQGNPMKYNEIIGNPMKYMPGGMGGGQSLDGDVATAGRPLKHTKCGGAGLSRRLHKLLNSHTLRVGNHCVVVAREMLYGAFKYYMRPVYAL